MVEIKQHHTMDTLNEYQSKPKSILTNEEKAREIAEYLNQPNGSNSLLECHQAAMAMAEWKDEQHEQEKREWLNEAYDGLKPLLDPDSLMVVQQKLSELVYGMKVIE